MKNSYHIPPLKVKSLCKNQEIWMDWKFYWRWQFRHYNSIKNYFKKHLYPLSPPPHSPQDDATTTGEFSFTFSQPMWTEPAAPQRHRLDRTELTAIFSATSRQLTFLPISASHQPTWQHQVKCKVKVKSNKPSTHDASDVLGGDGDLPLQSVPPDHSWKDAGPSGKLQFFYLLY